jgi:hypothetical protein
LVTVKANFPSRYSLPIPFTTTVFDGLALVGVLFALDVRDDSGVLGAGDVLDVADEPPDAAPTMTPQAPIRKNAATVPTTAYRQPLPFRSGGGYPGGGTGPL